jgi:hypothetical protein
MKETEKGFDGHPTQPPQPTPVSISTRKAVKKVFSYCIKSNHTD